MAKNKRQTIEWILRNLFYSGEKLKTTFGNEIYTYDNDFRIVLSGIANTAKKLDYIDVVADVIATSEVFKTYKHIDALYCVDIQINYLHDTSDYIVETLDLRNIKALPDSSFIKNRSLKKIRLDSCRIIYDKALKESSIEELDLPSCEILCDSCLDGCRELKYIHADKVVSIGSLTFINNYRLTKIDLPACKTLHSNSIVGTRNLKEINLSGLEYYILNSDNIEPLSIYPNTKITVKDEVFENLTDKMDIGIPFDLVKLPDTYHTFEEMEEAHEFVEKLCDSGLVEQKRYREYLIKEIKDNYENKILLNKSTAIEAQDGCIYDLEDGNLIMKGFWSNTLNMKKMVLVSDIVQKGLGVYYGELHLPFIKQDKKNLAAVKSRDLYLENVIEIPRNSNYDITTVNLHLPNCTFLNSHSFYQSRFTHIYLNSLERIMKSAFKECTSLYAIYAKDCHSVNSTVMVGNRCHKEVCVFDDAEEVRFYV